MNMQPQRIGSIHKAQFASTCNFTRKRIHVGDMICMAVLPTGEKRWVLLSCCDEKSQKVDIQKLETNKGCSTMILLIFFPLAFVLFLF